MAIKTIEFSRFARDPNRPPLLIDANGIPTIYDAAKLHMRQLLGAGYPVQFYMICDSDRGRFDRFEEALSTYLHTKCKTHNINPELISNQEDKTITLTDINTDVTLCLRFLSVPGSLEIQLCSYLKTMYSVDESLNADSLIQALAKAHFDSDEDRLVRTCCKGMISEDWVTEISSTLRHEFIS